MVSGETVFMPICEIREPSLYHTSEAILETDANKRLIVDAPRLADENERLRSVNAELVEALKFLGDAPLYDKEGEMIGGRGKPDYAVSLATARRIAREALAHAEEVKP